MNQKKNKKNFKIALIPGDGIGKEVVPEGVRVLEALATWYSFDIKFDSFPFGCEHYLEHGAGSRLPVGPVDSHSPSF